MLRGSNGTGEFINEFAELFSANQTIRHGMMLSFIGYLSCLVMVCVLGTQARLTSRLWVVIKEGRPRQADRTQAQERHGLALLLAQTLLLGHIYICVSYGTGWVFGTTAMIMSTAMCFASVILELRELR